MGLHLCDFNSIAVTFLFRSGPPVFLFSFRQFELLSCLSIASDFRLQRPRISDFSNRSLYPNFLLPPSNPRRNLERIIFADTMCYTSVEHVYTYILQNWLKLYLRRTMSTPNLSRNHKLLIEISRNINA